MIGIVIVAGAVALAAAGFFFASGQPVAPSGGVRVVASFYPLAEFARQVGGDRVKVVNLTPAGVEPHDFEPSPRDIATVYGANLLILNGAGLDIWAERLRPDMEARGVIVVDMARAMNTFSADPHFWLDPVLAAREVEAIRDILIEVDPAGGDGYRTRAERYLAKLAALDRAYRDGLASCAQREVVTSHAAFGYLAKRYNMSVVSIAGLSPDEEPSPRKLAEVVTLVRERGIQYIFTETLASPKLAQMITDETGAGILVFNPLEGLTEEEIHSGENYIFIMEANLKNLRKALVCQ